MALDMVLLAYIAYHYTYIDTKENDSGSYPVDENANKQQFKNNSIETEFNSDCIKTSEVNRAE